MSWLSLCPPPAGRQTRLASNLAGLPDLIDCRLECLTLLHARGVQAGSRRKYILVAAEPQAPDRIRVAPGDAGSLFILTRRIAVKALLVTLVMSMLAACTGVEQDQDDKSPTLGSAESEVRQPHGGGVGAFCGGFGNPPCNPGLFCRLGVCTPPSGIGGPCGGIVDPPCASGLFCILGSCS